MRFRQQSAGLAKIMLQEVIERHLQAAERHITIGETCIARQRAVIARLECEKRHEDLLREAIRLLAQFVKIQAFHLADRDRLISELSRAMTDRRIAQGQFRIAQQREMISRLEACGEDSQSSKDQLALLEGTQTALLAHRDSLDETDEEDAEDLGRTQAALLSLLRTGIADMSAKPTAIADFDIVSAQSLDPGSNR